jgi:mitochondrial import inner membrane translocase subunit TIM23
MYVEDKYTLKPRKSKDDMYLEGYGKHWGEKLTFTIGVSYCVSAGLGFFVGLRRVRPASMLAIHQRAVHNVVQSLRTASEFGNSGAAASLLYCFVGKMIDLLLEEEIKDYGYWARNVLAGAVTGGLYKSTLGIRPMIFGSMLGVGIISGLTYCANTLHDRGLIGFRIEV